MKRISFLSLAVLVLAWSAVAQSGTQAQSQTNASTSSNTSVSAGKSGANAQSDTSVSASQNTSAPRDRAKKGKAESGASGRAAASQSASAGSAGTSTAAGTTLNAVLTKSVDARKAKEGDEVMAKTTSAAQAEGQTTIPKGAKLVGHVTRAKARAKGDSESALGIVFDRAEFGKGQQVPFHAVVQALAVTGTSAGMMDDEPMGAAPRPAPSGGGMATGGGGLVGGAVNTVGNTAGAVANTSAQVAGSAAGSAAGTLNGAAGVGAATSSTLNAGSRGVAGLPGYALDATAANATQGSVITSTGKNVKLDSGTQMLLRVVSE